jgi:ribosomal protein L13E
MGARTYPEVISPWYRHKPRRGKGFSLEELKASNVSIGQVRTSGLPVDERRRSSRQENIKLLKKIFSKKEDKKKTKIQKEKPEKV